MSDKKYNTFIFTSFALSVLNLTYSLYNTRKILKEVDKKEVDKKEISN